MIQCREELRFTFETGETIRIGRERRRQYLQRDVTTQFRVARPIDLSHPARAEQRQDFVRADSRSGGDPHRIRMSVSDDGIVVGPFGFMR